MPDNLRDRIATALGGELYVNLLGNGYDADDLLALADAVITALKEDPNVEIRGTWQRATLKSDHLPPLPHDIAMKMFRQMDGGDTPNTETHHK